MNKSGIWNYNGKELKVCITLHDVDLGSGDGDDPIEERYDRKADTYYIWFEQGAGIGEYIGGGIRSDSLSGAMEKAEALIKADKIFWSE